MIEILRIKYEWEMMRRMNVLTLSASISNWIILADILNTTTDRRLYIKVFHDYVEVLPIYKVSEICMKAQTHLCESNFQYVLDTLWKCVAIFQERYR